MVLWNYSSKEVYFVSVQNTNTNSEKRSIVYNNSVATFFLTVGDTKLGWYMWQERSQEVVLWPEQKEMVSEPHKESLCALTRQ